MGLATVAVYSDVDRAALHVLHADEAYRLGPGPATESYLRGDLILEIARQAGARRLEGWFLPSQKNAPAKHFFPRHCFQLVETTDQGSRWGLDLATAIECPPWIRLNYAGNHR